MKYNSIERFDHVNADEVNRKIYNLKLFHEYIPKFL